jgi:hypothetical protein
VHVDWQTLGEITVVSTAAALVLVLLVACALVTSSGPVDPQGAASAGGKAPGNRTAVATAVTTLCLVAAGLVVVYGIHLIVA